MIVEINDPSRADDLVAFLRSARCEAEHAGTTKINVSLPGAPSEQAARGELDAYLLAWQTVHPGASARRKSRYDL